VAWFLLAVAGLLEILWAMTLKHADGLTRPWAATLAFVAAMASLALLSASLKSLPVGTAYAAWVGIGIVGVTIAGAIAFAESLSALRLGAIALITVGLVMLRLTES
jgi:quaternary ammonium compound-resistance protein SugE